MSLIRTCENWIRSVFRLLFRRGSEKRDNDLYVETLTEYLLHHRSLRPRSLSNPSLRSLSLSRSSFARLLPTGRKKGIPQHGRPCASTCSAPASPPAVPEPTLPAVPEPVEGYTAESRPCASTCPSTSSGTAQHPQRPWSSPLERDGVIFDGGLYLPLEPPRRLSLPC